MQYAQAAYRTSEARSSRPGFQGGGGVNSPRQRASGAYTPPRAPANDNKPPIHTPTPANDNQPGYKPAPTKGARGSMTRKGWGLLKGAARRLSPSIQLGVGSAKGWMDWGTQLGIDPLGVPWPFDRHHAFQFSNGWFAPKWNCTWNGVRYPGHVVDGETTGAHSTSCLQLQAGGRYIGGLNPNGLPPTANAALGKSITIAEHINAFIVGNIYHPFSPTVVRWRSVASMDRVAANVDPNKPTIMTVVNGRATWHAPFWPAVNPMIDPMSLPLGQPVSQPSPIPYRALPHRRVNPWRSPVERSTWGHDTAPAIAPRLRPYQVGAINTTITGTAVKTNPNGRHNMLPPGAGEKEKKGSLPGWGAALNNAIGHATEALDAIDAVYYALPASIRAAEFAAYGGYMGPQDKLAAIWRNAQHIDPLEVAKNLILNAAQDRAIGKASRTASRGVRNQGLDFGTVGLGRI
jgi:hypothetical protein